MAGPKWLEWLLVVVFALAIANWLRKGNTSVWFKVGRWQVVSRDDDPREYWAIIIGCAVVAAGLIADVLLR